MTGSDVKEIREKLGDALGRRLSQRDLGLALRLSEGNAARAIRDWEEGSGPTGPEVRRVFQGNFDADELS